MTETPSCQLPSMSIVTCTWNSAWYLSQSIASVLEQTYAPVEYIFVDGGSDDGTLEMIENIPRQTQILRDVRGGISRAMNAGIEAATGDVIAHLHSDDYYLDPGVLEHIVTSLAETGAAWAFGTMLNDYDGQLTPLAYTVPRYSYSRLLKANFIPHPATFVRRALLEEVGGFDESLRYAMDYDLWLRLGRVAAPLQSERPLAAFRRHAESLSTANVLAAHDETYRVRMQHIGALSPRRVTHYLRYLRRRARLERRNR